MDHAPLPYPGLRPFNEAEQDYFFGREEKSREVIEKLKNNHLVVILGNSGCGKSSLVKSGVLPKLRSHFIKFSGDAWKPIIFTPGSNFHNTDDIIKDGPFHRLDKAFSDEGKNTDKDNHLRADNIDTQIVEIMRNKDGFANLYEHYISTTNTEDNKTNLLFIIDQFEELFHESNLGNQDCEHLVWRILDHYKAPSPNVYLVLTMRSEHLNDCMAYTGLPEAINQSFYLVPQLNEEEIKEAIVGPANTYLDWVRQQTLDLKKLDALPDSIKFEEGVKSRIMNSVMANKRDKDHLSLLQHLLFRLWQSATGDFKTVFVPDKITNEHLDEAVSAGSQNTYDEGGILHDCIENWCKQLSGEIEENQLGSQLEYLLRRLARRDKSGEYSQQRVSLKQLRKDKKIKKEDLEKIEEIFTKPHPYFLIEDDNLKVAHESLIRGWTTFNQLIDEESKFSIHIKRTVADYKKYVRKKGDLLERKSLRPLWEEGIKWGKKFPLVNCISWSYWKNRGKQHTITVKKIMDIISSENYLGDNFYGEEIDIDGYLSFVEASGNKGRLSNILFTIGIPPAIFVAVVSITLWINNINLEFNNRYSASYMVSAETNKSFQPNEDIRSYLPYAILSAKIFTENKKNEEGHTNNLGSIIARYIYEWLPFVDDGSKKLKKIKLLAEPQVVNGFLNLHKNTILEQTKTINNVYTQVTIGEGKKYKCANMVGPIRPDEIPIARQLTKHTATNNTETKVTLIRNKGLKEQFIFYDDYNKLENSVCVGRNGKLHKTQLPWGNKIAFSHDLSYAFILNKENTTSQNSPVLTLISFDWDGFKPDTANSLKIISNLRINSQPLIDELKNSNNNIIALSTRDIAGFSAQGIISKINTRLAVSTQDNEVQILRTREQWYKRDTNTNLSKSYWELLQIEKEGDNCKIPASDSQLDYTAKDEENDLCIIINTFDNRLYADMYRDDGIQFKTYFNRMVFDNKAGEKLKIFLGKGKNYKGLIAFQLGDKIWVTPWTVAAWKDFACNLYDDKQGFGEEQKQKTRSIGILLDDEEKRSISSSEICTDNRQETGKKL